MQGMIGFRKWKRGLFVTLVDDLPVDELPEGSEMVGTTVLIIHIVSVLPNVEGEQWAESASDRVLCVWFLSDDEFAICVGRKPNPSRTEEGGAFLCEFLLESFETTELCFNGSGNLSCRAIVSLWSTESLEVEVVVEDLSCIVEDATRGLLHDFFERKLFESTTRQSGIEVVHVCL